METSKTPTSEEPESEEPESEVPPDTPDPVLSAVEDVQPPAAVSPSSVAPIVHSPDAEEPEAKFDMDQVRDKVAKSKVATREREEKLVQSAMEAKARKLAALKIGEAKGLDHREFLDDLHDGKVRNFDDIFSRFTISAGEFEVYVERKQPKKHRGVLISGIQRSIIEPMTHMDFAELYGSGSYMLTVYGPTPGGRLTDEGKPKRRAYTKPVRVDIPDPYEDNPPNPEMAVVATPDLEDQDMMRPGGRRVMGGATEADAHIREVELRHEENAEERRLRLQENERERDDERQADQRRAQTDLASQMLASKEAESERLHAEIREMRRQPSNGETAMEGVAQILAAVRPEGPSESELARLQGDLAEERRRNSDELRRLQDQHRGEVERLQRDKDDAVRHERERADREMSRSNDLARQREQDLRGQFEQRLSDERRNHDRDLQSNRESQLMMSKSGQDSFGVQLEVKQSEINRLSLDVTRLESELSQEKGKSLADRVNEFSGAAEALGFSKEDGERGWKDMIADAAVGLVQHAPALASAIKGGPPVQSMPRPMALPAPGVPQQVGTMQMPQPQFATEGMEMDFPDGNNSPPPIYPGQEPGEIDPLAHVVSPDGSEVPFEAGLQPGETPQQQVMTQEQAEAQMQAQQGVAAQGPSEEAGDSMEINDGQIMEFSEMFRAAHKDGVTPEEFSNGLIEQTGPMIAKHLVNDIQLDRVNAVLKAAPDGDSDPLVRRDGQKFLAHVWEKVAQKTS